jgi:hypothetical protein
LAAVGSVSSTRAALAGHDNAPPDGDPLHLGKVNDFDADGEPATSGLTSTTILSGNIGSNVLVVRNTHAGSGALAFNTMHVIGYSTVPNGQQAGHGMQVEGGTATSTGASALNTGGHGVRGFGGGARGSDVASIGGDGIRGTGGESQDDPSKHGIGVRGIGAGSGTTRRLGVRGETRSSVHPAIFGINEGSSYGILGQSSTGVGVRGIGFGSSGAGVEGVANGTGPGVWGFTSAGHAVLGNSQSGNGGVFSSSSGYGVSVNTTTGVVGVFAKGNPIAFQGQGNLTCSGTGQFGGGIVVSSRVADGSLRGAAAVTSAEALIEDVGRARLVNGFARVELDPVFTQLASASDYDVFPVPNGDCKGLYVAVKGAASFEVRELQGGKSTLDFAYRVVGRRRDSAGRFARLAEPPKPPDFPGAPSAPAPGPSSPPSSSPNPSSPNPGPPPPRR